MQKCAICGANFGLLNKVTLKSGEQICRNCRDLAKFELGLGAFDSFDFSVDDIHQEYFKKGIDLKSRLTIKENFRSEIASHQKKFKKNIYILGGNNLIDTPVKSEISQLDNGKIYFKDNSKEFYYLISLTFAGAKYHTLTTNSTEGIVHTKTNEKSKKKGKSGKVVAGAVIGSIILPGIGTAVGAYAGGKGKDKSKKKTSQELSEKRNSSELRKEVEDDSVCTLDLIRFSDHKPISITVRANSSDYYELKGLETTHTPSNQEENTDNVTRTDAIEKLKELKELADLGILSEEEFSQMKEKYIKLIK